MLPRNYPSYEKCCIKNIVVLVVSGKLFHEGYHEYVFPDGQQSEQIETNLKRLGGVRLEGSQKSNGNQNMLMTLCRKQREMQQT
jgi:hypothetical protein